jgi:hypothetical protein
MPEGSPKVRARWGREGETIVSFGEPSCSTIAIMVIIL